MDKIERMPSGLAQLMGLGELAAGLEDQVDPRARKSCCAALYQLEPVRLLLGDTLHPGGLALTHRLGKLAGIGAEDLVLDVACGRGASALAVARSFHCRVLGLDLGREAVADAARGTKDSDMGGRVFFAYGDGEHLPFAEGSLDVAICECSMSLFPDKGQGVSEIARVLRGGGRLGLSDVTVEPGRLPQELTGSLGQMLCLADALPVEGYRDLLSGSGLTLVHEEDASQSVIKLLGDIEGKLAVLRLLGAVSADSGPISDLLSQATELIEKVRELVADGGIGYWLFVAEKGGRGLGNL